MMICRECEAETDLRDCGGYGRVVEWVCVCGTDNYAELVPGEDY